ncbi:MAG: hypothetical protein EBQ99_10130, partial [Planctomycetes bacterium]|nr:hypothetical protein [Planctomycetota bacterium]
MSSGCGEGDRVPAAGSLVRVAEAPPELAGSEAVGAWGEEGEVPELREVSPSAPLRRPALEVPAFAWSSMPSGSCGPALERLGPTEPAVREAPGSDSLLLDPVPPPSPVNAPDEATPEPRLDVARRFAAVVPVAGGTWSSVSPLRSPRSGPEPLPPPPRPDPCLDEPLPAALPVVPAPPEAPVFDAAAELVPELEP